MLSRQRVCKGRKKVDRGGVWGDEPRRVFAGSGKAEGLVALHAFGRKEELENLQAPRAESTRAAQ